jgi:hypothetical protein
METWSKKISLMGMFLGIFAGLSLFAADISVPRLEMTTWGRMEEGDFALASVISADVALNGGYKYGILLGMNFETDDIAKALGYRNFSFGRLSGQAADPVSIGDYNALVDSVNDRFNNQAALSFRIAQATARNIFNRPLELSYFLGISDEFCSGDEFTLRFGTASLGTSYRGFFYFPKGIGDNMSRQYRGLHEVQGTGLSLVLTRWERVVPIFYLYQNFPGIRLAAGGTGDTRFSGDARVLVNQEKFNIETFYGMSLTTGMDLGLRGGILAHFAPGNGVEFFFQGGIPNYDLEETFSIDHFYFLLEPRLRLKRTAFYLTFFYHPLEYLHVRTEEERGRADLNLKFIAGDMRVSGFHWGLEATMGLKLDGFEDFSARVSPLISILSGGLQWDAKIRVNLLAFDEPKESFDVFIGVKTAY